MPGFILIPRGTFAFFLFALFSFSNASTDIPIARHYRAFGPLPYTSSERGLEPLKVLPFYSTVLDTLLSLKTFPSESAAGGKASWRDCPYNKSAKGVITAPFPDADRHLPYNAWAVANFSIQKYIGRPHLVQCSNPATIKLRQAFPSFESRVNLSSPSSEISCPGDVYEDGRSICSVRLWPGSYQILVQLSSFSNSSSFYCNFFTDPAGLSSNLLLTIDDIVTPHVVLKMRNDRAVATLAGAHCSFTLMNTHDQEWATGGSAELRDAPDGLKLRPQSQSDSHFPLPRIAPRQVHQLRINFFTEPDFLNQTAADGRLPESLNITIAVSYQIADAQHESLIELSFDVAVWSELTSYHFTYIDVDGSVQAAAVLPPRQNCVGAPAGDDKCSVLLSTHGAGVDAVGRAWTESYQVQNQSWVLLPTGRRKFGMNWEGPQLNSAITALRKFAEDLPGVPTDEKDLWKVRGDRWLQAGHSMGGHGALLLSTHYPDMLVAALPAMGWLRLSTSGEAAYKEQLPYSDAASRALLSLASSEYSADLYAENLLGIPFLARVGSDDDNVPPSNLRRFCRLLTENEMFHNFQPSVVGLSEIPRKGHWFDGVVDDDRLQRFIQRHLQTSQKPQLPKRFSLMTMNPASTGSRGGLRILSLEVVFQLSRIRVERDYPERGTWKISTENVRRFRYQAIHGITQRPDRFLIDASSHAIAVPSAVYEEDKEHIDFCVSLIDEKLPDTRSVIWSVCSDSDLWETERSTERGPDTSGPSARVLSSRKVLVVFPEGDVKLRDFAVFYSNSLYIRGISAQVTTDSSVSVGQLQSSDDANVVLLGGPSVNRMARKYYMDGLSADVTFSPNGFCISSLKCFQRPGTGIAFLSAGPRRTLLFYVAGTDDAGLDAALTYLPYGPASEVPEWIVVSKTSGFGFKGLGGVLGLGYWDYKWKLEVRRSYPAEFLFDVKKSGVTCASRRRTNPLHSLPVLTIALIIVGVVLGIAFSLRRKLRFGHHYKHLPNALVQVGQNTGSGVDRSQGN